MSAPEVDTSAKVTTGAMAVARQSRRRRGLQRLVTFADAVVAIAATLLVLPLVTTATAIGAGSVGGLLSRDRHDLLAFVLSFAVICRFWIAHHSLYEHVTDYTQTLIWCNCVFLLGIVFLPFPTELIGMTSSTNTTTLALYIGTMLLVTTANLAQQWIIVRSPRLQAADIRGTLSVIPALVATTAMCVALVVAVTVPTIGIWSLLLLAATGGGERWRSRRRAETSNPDTPTTAPHSTITGDLLPVLVPNGAATAPAGRSSTRTPRSPTS